MLTTRVTIELLDIYEVDGNLEQKRYTVSIDLKDMQDMYLDWKAHCKNLVKGQPGVKLISFAEFFAEFYRALATELQK